MKEITSKERERIENLSKPIAAGKNLQEFEELALELDGLISDLTSVQPKPKRKMKL